MDIHQIFNELTSCSKIKTKVEIARICGVSPPALSSWKSVPAGYVRRLEAASEGKVTRYQMRPDVFGVSADDEIDLGVA